MKLRREFYNFDRTFRGLCWSATFVYRDFSQLRERPTYLMQQTDPIIRDSFSFRSFSSFSLLSLSLSSRVISHAVLLSSLFLCVFLLFLFLLSLLQSSYQQLSTLTNNNSVSKQLSLGSWKLRMLSGYVCRVVAVLQKAATRN